MDETAFEMCCYTERVLRAVCATCCVLWGKEGKSHTHNVFPAEKLALATPQMVTRGGRLSEEGRKKVKVKSLSHV